MLRKIFLNNRGKVVGQWRKLHKNELRLLLPTSATVSYLESLKVNLRYCSVPRIGERPTLLPQCEYEDVTGLRVFCWSR